MSELPDGWRLRRLDQLLASPMRNGRSVPTRDDGFPVLRLTAIQDGRVELTATKGGAWEAAEAAPFVAAEGDLLVVRGNGSLHLVGRSGLVGRVSNPVAFPDTLIQVRPNHSVVDPRFLNLAFDAPSVRSQIEGLARTTAGIYKINQTHLSSLLIPVPPLEEQRRIVAILDDHFSRLDAAGQYVATARRRASVQMKSLLLEAVPDRDSYPEDWCVVTIGEAGNVKLGRQRHPDWHHGPNMMPYLRFANVFEDRIDETDVMEMHWPQPVFDQFRLEPGDVLLNEGQSPEFLGRPALYRGAPPDVAFTNTILRFRAREDVLPEWALLVFRRHMHAGRFMRESRITTNIGHLSASRLKSIEFPVPSMGEQEHVVTKVRSDLQDLQRVGDTLSVLEKRAQALRRSLLTAAFSGRLTPP